MSFPALEEYLTRLSHVDAETPVWMDAAGRVQGRYFNSTLTSAFQPVRDLKSGTIVGYEGYARSYSESDQGLCLWKLLDHAADDDESIKLDRLCRMLHAMNFFRQSGAGDKDLYLSVHARLLAGVGSDHGTAFRRILKALGLPQERVILQLPPIAEPQRWVLHHVADNYARNGFRIAVNATHASEGQLLLERVRPSVIKLNARDLKDGGASLGQLLSTCREHGVRVIFKRVDSERTLGILKELSTDSTQTIYVQGFLWDLPQASLAPASAPMKLLRQARQPFGEKGVA